ncbi:hypothetical protein [Pelagibacterium sp. H642]|uniref:hypothetical protein n=1 Tax=Pelagibacterium sp. H642 TaxID=1881069 RepID=UPI0028151279|nr:hypothetical protein [Pelagibacterium sp. H642]WMT92968.1 hypothetical protein NO934_18610 [Pelagibacterium sp. H642]
MFRESVSDRLNDLERSAVVVIMQRLHENDVAGTILKLGLVGNRKAETTTTTVRGLY